MVYYFMMASHRSSGYRDLEHTADWELEVWAPNIAGLFEQAARGMYELSGARLAEDERLERELEVYGPDREGLLVAFLTELLYLEEVEGLGFDHFEISIEKNTLRAHLEGARFEALSKEIKAITYHNLNVRESSDGFIARIVFDI